MFLRPQNWSRLNFTISKALLPLSTFLHFLALSLESVKAPPHFLPRFSGPRLRGQTQGDKPSPSADFRRFSQIFADSRLFLENKAFGKRRFSQKTADFRRKPQKAAGTSRKPQIGVCPLRFVPLSAALDSFVFCDLGSVTRTEFMRHKSSESEILAKCFADVGEKRGEHLAKLFADFRPSISRQSGRKKFHEKSSTKFPSRETTLKFFHCETLGAWGPKNSQNWICHSFATHGSLGAGWCCKAPCLPASTLECRPSNSSLLRCPAELER